MQYLLENAVKKNLAEGILLSGGLDTSIIAIIASKFNSLTAITVAFQNAPAPDIEYAVSIAKMLDFEHVIYKFNENELYDILPTVIKITKSFDPMEIRNSVVIYVGLKMAKEHGIHSILTGDGADELLAGYSFLFGFKKGKLDMELRKLCDVMEFSSIKLAYELGIEAKLPFLESKFKNFALNLDSQYKIRKEKEHTFGKWILRKAYEEILPEKIIWREKTPIEVGSGTTILQNFFNKIISDNDFHEKRKKYRIVDKVTIRDKEHLVYYEIYRKTVGFSHSITIGGKICPHCRSNITKNATYCRTCGAYPI